VPGKCALGKRHAESLGQISWLEGTLNVVSLSYDVLQSLGSSKSSFSSGCCPSFWNNVFDLTIGHGWQPCQNVMQISVGLDTVAPATFDDRVNDCAALAGIGITKK
jgi:hypothetical protein